MRYFHLIAFILAGTIIGSGIYGIHWYAQTLSQRYAYALSADHPDLNISGTTLPKAVYASSDLLPIYGASEVIREDTQYQPNRFFTTHPTGFAPYNMAHPASGLLITAQQLASLGNSIDGKKLVISFTPGQFTTKTLKKNYYDGLVSRLHYYQILFSTDLPLNLRRQFATRMAQYPEIFSDDQFLSAAITDLTHPSLSNDQNYKYISLIGQARLWIMERQEEYETIVYLLQNQYHLETQALQRPIKKPIEWQTILTSAENEQLKVATNNKYGFEAGLWTGQRKYFHKRPVGSYDDRYLTSLSKSQEWDDLKLLLTLLQEHHVQALFIGRPMQGEYMNDEGVSTQAQNYFYDRLEATIAPYHYPLYDFREYTFTKYFDSDASGHTGRVGWVHIDKILNDFYHGRIT